MIHPADRDTTAHRYFTNAEIAEVIQAMDRGYASATSTEIPAEWWELSRKQREHWVAVIEEYRRQGSAIAVYEALSGEPWSQLPRDEQIRQEMAYLLVTGLSSVQR